MSTFKIKVQTKSNQYVENGLNENTTVSELKSHLAILTGYSLDQMNILSGFPPKPLDLNNRDATLKTIGVNSGDTLLVKHLEEKPQPVVPALFESEKEMDANFDKQMIGNQGILMRKVVPSDNSCLFTSIAFVIGGRYNELKNPQLMDEPSHNYDDDLKSYKFLESDRAIDIEAPGLLRKIIADYIMKGFYKEILVEKSIEEYSEWIKNKASWGGSIELSIFSIHYGIEICVVDTINENIKQFGEDKVYSHRVFLIFDGIHYDPLYLEDPSSGMIQTIIPCCDNDVMIQATELAKEAKSSGQFTDIYRFTLKCNQCHTSLVGSKEAQIHAKDTGHTDFGEIET